MTECHQPKVDHLHVLKEKEKFKDYKGKMGERMRNGRFDDFASLAGQGTLELVVL